MIVDPSGGELSVAKLQTDLEFREKNRFTADFRFDNIIVFSLLGIGITLCLEKECSLF